MKLPLDLVVRGGSKEQRLAVRTATRWMVPYLLGKRLTKFIFLSVRLSASLVKEKLDGEAAWLYTNIRPRDFSVRIDQTLSPDDVLLTLAHELVHVKQYAKNDMFDYAHNAALTRWKKKVVNTDNMPHSDLPWEQEASTLERTVVAAYLRAMRRRQK